MSIIKVNNRMINVDVREELEQFEFKNARWSDEKLIASSPFREDSSPSFFITFEGENAGIFGDSGYDDEYFKSGQLPKLLAFLRDESYEESCQYLLEKYDAEYSDDVIRLINPQIRFKKSKVILDERLYKKKLDTTYLKNRGIHQKIIELNGVFDNENSIGIPWKDCASNVCAIKYRHKNQKTFWYEDNATPLSNLIFGLNIVIEKQIQRIAICEAEIDALTWQSAGVMAVAVGGARFNKKQADMIIQSGVKTVILAGDNDEPGRKFNRLVRSMLEDYVEIEEIEYDDFEDCKDANELSVMKLKRVRTKKILKNPPQIRV